MTLHIIPRNGSNPWVFYGTSAEILREYNRINRRKHYAGQLAIAADVEVYADGADFAVYNTCGSGEFVVCSRIPGSMHYTRASRNYSRFGDALRALAKEVQRHE